MGLRHQELVMQENRAYSYYPTIAENPRRVRFPSTRPNDDVAIPAMSCFMTAEYMLIAELVRDATRARRLLGAAMAPPPLPTLSHSSPPVSTAPPTPPPAVSLATQL
jgi:hypothetical protein